MTVHHSIVSAEVLGWAMSAAVVFFGIFWAYRDGAILMRLWSKGPEFHDERFGCVIGLAIALVGFTGVLKYHLGF